MRRNPEPVPPAVDVPERVDLAEELRSVRNPAQSAIWNEITEHPLGKAALVGVPCGFVPWLASRGGSLGAATGGARPLDWLGRQDAGAAPSPRSRVKPFSDPSRHRYLASQVLSMSLQAQDFEKRYGHHPWLVETLSTRRVILAYRSARRTVWA